VQPESDFSHEARRNAHFTRYSAEDPVRGVGIDGMDQPELLNFPFRSVTLELQDLSFVETKYKRTYMGVKHKSEVISFKANTLGARIRELRKSAGMNQSEFGKSFGVSQVAVSNWEKDADKPSVPILARLANMTTDEELRADLMHHAGLVIEMKSNRPKEAVPEDIREVILLRDSVAAGTARALDEREIEKVLRLPREWFHPGGEIFALKVSGDSMAPIIEEGYTVFVDTAKRDPKKLVNKMVAARDGEGVTIKWLRRDVGLYLLVPHNVTPRHPVRVLNSEPGWGIVGEVVKWVGQPKHVRS